MPLSTRLPIRLAIVNDYPVVVAGTAQLLAGYPDRVVVVELDSRLRVASDVDIVLCDTFAFVAGDGVELADLARVGTAKLVVFSLATPVEAAAQARAQGAAACLSKALGALQLVEALEAIHTGTAPAPFPQEPGEAGPGDWPGRAFDLTPREAEMIALVTEGLTNDEIARATYLSINSVKTYIRLAYRKVGVSRRSQAVRWGLENGFSTRAVRAFPAERTDLRHAVGD